ncbi:unnamed protein product [[Actinomadura] parvosata subsp. kistnae]|uniref:Fe2OG dioxygenase domain-containing protein n=1 Tax=[Actinomadura] parvosata subsp. kistnae TaxID=1909395 RepID=A0A1V0ADG6_9ACTN|nr:hypothetical protein [Nonomuraea sp. ATCC 55076]AQZ68233.1 hypothetical protein BKM31_48260 [Nonomuraea sp. ATCC 55076]SPL93359.1 unnamed protein product [Actinomadura parvosata subsp. kistnae]
MSIELRDRFFVLSAGDASAEEVARYRAEVDAADAAPAATVDGLDVCWHPTARFKAVRFIDAELIDERVRELFARPSAQAPYLAAVFADPHELSFRTFENIVPLDRLFESVPLEMELDGATEHAEGVLSYTLRLPEQARDRLARLDALGLYVPPLNAASRGGERFIFHSALLAEALTAAVADALPPSVAEGFSHVNPVFRCNAFEPGDANFHLHRDTPYYDAARGHISRYTLLLYVTGGTGSPALDLAGGAALAEIGPFTCVIFDQRYEHEGAPYRDGRKVFLRTELVFAAGEVTEQPEIGALFSKACYLTGESVFAPELARHADAYYNQVAAAHWSGLGDGPARETFVHKEFRGLHFVTNGYDFWFPATDALPAAECAAVTLLDYFNCKLGDTPFRALCRTEVIEADDAAWIPDFLRDQHPTLSVTTQVDKSAFFPDPERPDGANCCPFHSSGRFDPTRFDDVIKLYEDAQSFAKAHILPAPILMLGEDVALDPDRFVIDGDLIHVLGKHALTPVNFAACWNDESIPEDYVVTAARVGVQQLLVPPIIHHESNGCRHLSFDFFRNSWMVDHRQATIPVPRITELMWADPDDSHAWRRDVDDSLIDAEHPLESSDLWDDEDDDWDDDEEDS